MASTLTAKQAYEIASQWGSMMHAGDPGYVFYTFSGDKAVVQDEDHRAALIAYTESCLNFNPANFSKAEQKQNLKDLTALKAYFESATLPIPPLDEFTEAYIEAALWSTTDSNNEDNDDTALDANYSAQDISAETMAEIIADCKKFQADNADVLTDDNLVKGNCSVSKQAGHDFWLTRNGHGCGFWDGDWTDVADEKLTAASKAFGEVDLYVGDDGKLYI